MIKLFKIYFLAVALIFLAATFRLSLAQDSSSKALSVGNIFSLTIPYQWTEIPTSEIEKFSARVKNLNPRLRKQQYNIGFSLAGKPFFSYPYILVQVDKSGRVSESKLEELVKSSRLQKLTGVQISDEFNNVLSQINTGETVYDSENKIDWFTISSEIKGVGEVSTLSASKLTKFGAINLYCYLLRGEHTTYAPVFESLVEGIKVVSEFEW